MKMSENTVSPTGGGRLQIRELAFLNGMKFPSDEELLMLILGSGTRVRPIDVLAGDIMKVILGTNEKNLVDELVKIRGMGRNKALAVAASLELGRRMNRNPQAHLSAPTDVIPFIQGYSMQPQEHFLCVSLNGAQEIISIRVLCVGSGNMAVLRPAEVFSEAIKEHAAAIVISHNHPGGNPEPSDADIKTTERILRAAEILGMTLLDHIIISKNGYFSFLENGMLK